MDLFGRDSVTGGLFFKGSVLTFFLSLLTLWGAPVAAISVEQALAGELTVLSGESSLKRPGVAGATAAAVGDPLYVGDTFSTGSAARAQIVFTDGSFINVAEATSLVIYVHKYQGRNGTRKTLVKVYRGKARFIVPLRAMRASAFLVETETALMSTDFADFIVTARPGESALFVLDRSVTVKNISYLTVGTRRLGPGHWTVVGEESPPEPPRATALKVRRELLGATDVY